jgi:hypothetical protein
VAVRVLIHFPFLTQYCVSPCICPLSVGSNQHAPPAALNAILFAELLRRRTRFSCIFVWLLLKSDLWYSIFFSLGLPLWNSPFHFGFLYLRQSVGLLGRVISSSQGLSTCTQTQKNAHTHTNTTHPFTEWDSNPLFRASEDSACLRLLGYRDWRYSNYWPQIWRNVHRACILQISLTWEPIAWHQISFSCILGNKMQSSAYRGTVVPAPVYSL